MYTQLLCPIFADEEEEMERRSGDKDESGLFLYVDMHGHASKKGIFMYGNHFDEPQDSIACMLVPKLMSLNNANFHFTSCNFTEKNMYLMWVKKGKRQSRASFIVALHVSRFLAGKIESMYIVAPFYDNSDKRDGMSREGSGRVAVYKMTGLLRSYTLECNYNTGRLVNALPPRVRDGPPSAQPTTKQHLYAPPKYTPAIYQEVTIYKHPLPLPLFLFASLSSLCMSLTLTFPVKWYTCQCAKTQRFGH